MREYGKDYQALIDKVARIDCDAANSLLHVAPAMPHRRQPHGSLFDFDPNDCVCKCFYWYSTPQGVKYWGNIDMEVECG